MHPAGRWVVFDAGGANLALSIPNDPRLLATEGTCQFAVEDPSGVFLRALSLTPGVRLVIGRQAPTRSHATLRAHAVPLRREGGSCPGRLPLDTDWSG